MIFPSIWQSERFCKANNREKVLYVWMTSQADDEGRSDIFLDQAQSGAFLMQDETLE